MSKKPIPTPYIIYSIIITLTVIADLTDFDILLTQLALFLIVVNHISYICTLKTKEES